MLRRARQFFRNLRARKDIARFASLISEPGSGELALPASGSFEVESVAGNVDDAEMCIVNGRTLHAPELIAGGRTDIDYIWQGSTVEMMSGFDLYLCTGNGRTSKILEG